MQLTLFDDEHFATRLAFAVQSPGERQIQLLTENVVVPEDQALHVVRVGCPGWEEVLTFKKKLGEAINDLDGTSGLLVPSRVREEGYGAVLLVYATEGLGMAELLSEAQDRAHEQSPGAIMRRVHYLHSNDDS